MIHDRTYMRETPYRTGWSLTVILIVLNAALYASWLIANLVRPGLAQGVLAWFALVPEDLARGWIWQLLTFQFLHGGPLHLLINCAVLYMFGRPVEATLGRPVFLRLYLGSGAAGGLLQATCSWLLPAHFGTGPVVGASAGVFGLIAAFALLNRETPITTFVAFIIPVTMKAKYLLIVESVIAMIGVLGPQDGIAHAAHLGGMLAALAYLVARQLAAERRLRWPRVRTVPTRRELVGAPVPHAARGQQRQTSAPEPLSSPDFISREVDPILDKISAHGIHSLTERERRILELARNRMNRP